MHARHQAHAKHAPATHTYARPRTRIPSPHAPIRLRSPLLWRALVAHTHLPLVDDEGGEVDVGRAEVDEDIDHEEGVHHDLKVGKAAEGGLRIGVCEDDG